MGKEWWMGGKPWWLGKPQSAMTAAAPAAPAAPVDGGCENETALRALSMGHVTWSGLAPAVRTRLINSGVRSGHWVQRARGQGVSCAE
jgi:hypothetical protein